MTILRLVLSTAALTFSLHGQTIVDVRDGNVYATRDGQMRQITTAGLDVEATLSHDGQRIAFIRRSAGVPDELRIVDITGDKGEKVLAKAFGVERPTGSFSAKELNTPRFSPDDAYIYLIEGNVLNRVEVATGAGKALMGDVQRYAVIKTGANRGRLLLSRRARCFIEDLSQECHPVYLGTTTPAVNWKRLAKDDEYFEDLLEQYSR